MTTRDAVLARLRGDKIQLWLPPYRLRGVSADDNVALSELAESLARKLTAEDERSDGGNSSAAQEIRNVLVELQNHAVQKLIDRNSLDVKILTSRLATTHISRDGDSDAGTDVEDAFTKASWGDEVSILKDTDQNQGDSNSSSNGNNNSISNNSNHNSLRLHVSNLSPTLTIDKFSNDICRAMDAKTVRVIWRGKNLLSSSASGDGKGAKSVTEGKGSDGEVDTLCKLMEASGIGGKTGGALGPSQKKKGELLCLVSGTGYVGPAAEEATGSNGAGTAPPRTDASVIRSIRTAAGTLQNSQRGMRFEVTDQSGNLVPMRESDTVAFLTALGLHRIGRSKMERQQLDSGDGTMLNSNNSSDPASALVFLLEADAEWNDSPALADWKAKVDNYGLLQLDIAWCYLLLESLDGLDDAVRRLGIAEKALRKQVHSNFVTLALAQAEMENAIPPLCAVFVRLFLLQGVAHKLLQRQQGGDSATFAEERLAWAKLLCQRLRSSAPPDAVEALCLAYVVDPPAAVAALRQSNGDPDAAGNAIAADREEEGRAARKRRRQGRAGRCANGTDFVDLDLVGALAGMLGFGDSGDFVGANEDASDDEDELFGGDLPTGTVVAIGLLRLTDNSIDRSLELYNTIGADQVLERVARLDQASGRRNAWSTKRTKPIQHKVRDVDVAMLVSMGAEEAQCRAALRATGNVEGALLWLSGGGGGGGGRDDVRREGELGGTDASPDRSDGGGGGRDDARREGELGGADASADKEDWSESDANISAIRNLFSRGAKHAKDIANAHTLLERELGNALGTGSKQLLEKEWLGVDMHDEWDLIQKYG